MEQQHKATAKQQFGNTDIAVLSLLQKFHT
jgi:hypothetical protein